MVEGSCHQVTQNFEYVIHASIHGRASDLAAQARVWVRLGWGQVFDSPCRTAGKVARVLALRGWTGRPVACGPGCSAVAGGRGVNRLEDPCHQVARINE